MGGFIWLVFINLDILAAAVVALVEDLGRGPDPVAPVAIEGVNQVLVAVLESHCHLKRHVNFVCYPPVIETQPTSI